MAGNLTGEHGFVAAERYPEAALAGCAWCGFAVTILPRQACASCGRPLRLVGESEY